MEKLTWDELISNQSFYKGWMCDGKFQTYRDSTVANAPRGLGLGKNFVAIQLYRQNTQKALTIKFLIASILSYKLLSFTYYTIFRASLNTDLQLELHFLIYHNIFLS